MSYHISPNGPRPCKATVRKCPLGGEHFEDKKDAEAAFEASLSASGSLSKKDSRLAPFTIAPIELDMEHFDTMVSLYGGSKRVAEEAKEVCVAIAAGEIPERFPSSLQFHDDFKDTLTASLTHSTLCELGYYGRATKATAESIAANVGDGTVLDPMAGRGFFTKALRNAGVKTIASDDHSWSAQEQTEKLDAIESVKKYGNQISHVLLSWVPYGSDKDLEILELCRKDYPHITIINIGERRGCTGSDEFWEHAEEVELETPIAYSSTSSIHDFVAFVK